MISVNHIAFLVNNIEAAAQRLPDFCRPQGIETQPTEGTRELYVEIEDSTVSLLLVEAIAEGPYRRALKKRGTGLHHIGCLTDSLERHLDWVMKHRLLLHPISMHTMKHGGLWLCRPEVPFLIEIVENPEMLDASKELELKLKIPGKRSIPDFLLGFFKNLSIETVNEKCVRIEMKSKQRDFAFECD